MKLPGRYVFIILEPVNLKVVRYQTVGFVEICVTKNGFTIRICHRDGFALDVGTTFPSR